MTDRELMQRALEALDGLSEPYDVLRIQTALRERLAHPVQEPVATVTSESGNPNVSMSWWHEPALPVGTKLYTSPPASKPWVGLTEAEIDYQAKKDDHAIYFALGVLWAEAKLREKNT